MGRKALLIAILVSGFGCKSMTELKPGRCEKASDCKSGVCDETSKTCVDLDSGTADSLVGPTDTPVVSSDTLVVDSGVKKDISAVTDGEAVDAPVVDAPVGDTAIIGCRDSSDCPGSRSLCVGNVCVECASAEDCKDPSKSFCAGGTCVGCEQAGASACPGKVCAPDGTPDAGGQCVECVTSANCKSATAPVCEGNACVGCTSGEQCKAKSTATPACLTTTGTCVACAASTDCPETAKLCDPSTHTCVGCTSSQGCPAGTPICTAGVCGGCGTSKQCAERDPGKPLCDQTGACVACTGNGDCGGKYCDPVSKTCVACVTHQQCSGATPICEGNVCMSCTTATKTCGERDAKLPACAGGGSCVECTAADATACTGTKRMCNTTTSTCVQCMGDGDCSGTSPICSNNTCVACGSAAECKAKDAATPACVMSGAQAGKCVACTDNTTCNGLVCKPTTSICVECLADTDCTEASKPICDTSTNTCGACKSPAACSAKNAGTPVCLASGACVQCQGNADCGGTTPICNTGNNTCQPCTTDSQCTGVGPGICILADGHCATNDETITVTTAGGTLPSAAIPTGKNLLLIGGTVVGTLDWDLAGRTRAMTIAGQPGANGRIDGNNALVTVRATGNGHLYIKNLLITGGGGTGLRVEGSATIHLDHVKVNDNPGGGIAINNAGFDFKNTTVNGNGASTNSPGIALQNLPASGKPKSMTNVSVTSNQGVGVSCSAASDTPSPASGILLTGTFTPLTNCNFTAGATCTVASTTCGAQP